MNPIAKNWNVIILVLFSSALFAGCSTPKTIYQWGAYQPEVYQYFKGGSVEEQIMVLEKDMVMLDAKGALAPPGFHAHLGMLYATAGNIELSTREFITEKKLFPESTPYMDFLMNKTRKKEK